MQNIKILFKCLILTYINTNTLVKRRLQHRIELEN